MKYFWVKAIQQQDGLVWLKLATHTQKNEIKSWKQKNKCSKMVIKTKGIATFSEENIGKKRKQDQHEYIYRFEKNKKN